MVCSASCLHSAADTDSLNLILNKRTEKQISGRRPTVRCPMANAMLLTGLLLSCANGLITGRSSLLTPAARTTLRAPLADALARLPSPAPPECAASTLPVRLTRACRVAAVSAAAFCVTAAVVRSPALCAAAATAGAATASALPVGAVTPFSELVYQLQQLILQRTALCLLGFSAAAVAGGAWLFRRVTGETLGSATFKVCSIPPRTPTPAAAAVPRTLQPPPPSSCGPYAPSQVRRASARHLQNL
jgi:hypothetical protein